MGSANEEDILIEESFTYNGITYGLPETETLMNGQDKKMANSTYAEFIESAQ